MRKSYLSLEQRIHNAEGAQAAETIHARHAFLHAKSFGPTVMIPPGPIPLAGCGAMTAYITTT